MKVQIKKLDETRAFTREFAKTLKAPTTIALHGDLGMGKTEISRAIINEVLGVDTIVPSPTFTIVQNYDGISHFDLYRIKDVSELEEIGLVHAIDNDIVLIEWPEIAKDILPKNTIHIYITGSGEEREIELFF